MPVFALGLDKPRVQDVVDPLRVAGAITNHDLAQARLGDNELEAWRAR